MMIKPGEEIIADRNEHFRVVDVVVFDEEDESPFVGLLIVEAAKRALPLTACPQPAPWDSAAVLRPRLGRRRRSRNHLPCEQSNKRKRTC
jgi:hypothetical protein